MQLKNAYQIIVDAAYAKSMNLVLGLYLLLSDIWFELNWRLYMFLIYILLLSLLLCTFVATPSDVKLLLLKRSG